MLGNTLKEIRTEKGFTQDDLANYLNVKRQTYSAYERGVSVPDANTLKSIADFLNVSTDFLLSREIKNPPASEQPDDIDINDISFALYGEVHDLNNDENKSILEFAQYVRQKRKIQEDKKN